MEAPQRHVEKDGIFEDGVLAACFFLDELQRGEDGETKDGPADGAARERRSVLVCTPVVRGQHGQGQRGQGRPCPEAPHATTREKGGRVTVGAGMRVVLHEKQKSGDKNLERLVCV